ncbi:Disease resistance protein L6 [Linum grandiflorum]
MVSPFSKIQEMDYYMRVGVTIAATLLPVLVTMLYKWFSSSNNHSRRSRRQLETTTDYKVFLSFRGPDAREFVDILHRKLARANTRAFKDDEVNKGEELSHDTVKAIDECEVFVVVVSKNYANDTMCLREIAEITERQKQDDRRVMLPVFYMVEPKDVKFLIGPYQKSFMQHHRNFPEATVQRWKIAFSDVGSLKGWQVKSENEHGATAEQVSGAILSQLSKNSDNGGD